MELIRVADRLSEWGAIKTISDGKNGRVLIGFFLDSYLLQKGWYE